MLKKPEDLLKEKLKLEYEDNKESKMIQFLGGKLSIYLLVVTILTFTVVLLYNHISGAFTPLYIIINSLIAPVIVAYIFFYVLRPVTNFLVNKISLPRGVSSILSILILITVVIAIVVGALPAIVEQTQHLITSLPGYINVVKQYLANNSDNTIVKTVNDYINTNLNTTQLSATAFDIFSGIVGGAASALSSTATVLMTAPFVLYYLLKDSSKFYDFVLGKLPKKSKPFVIGIVKEIDNKVGSYISGQMLVSLCIGILLFIGYQIIGLPYAVSLATLAAILSIVPYLGPIIAITPAMLVAAGTGWVMVIKMLVVWCIVQFLEGNFISPNIMGKTMNQHPLTVIFVILISANMMGIVGAIIGIPLYAILKIFAEKLIYLLRKRYNRIYKN
ncbi:AI-2E family transporter [Gemelliphila palaticanis]|uniref:AI-2E family transporter n=1 Tax=Gemelliphila palaticanis TaxID=81950 RepID=A0ABX2T358_9BACL|nr:AI-2E family transporter [Gemella palaticanis]MBF0716128.1 AI-2E family transporter [Gemella palaticanis]NYS48058.1 AI-2E family transporter [Gemella palaticanis]